MSGEASDGGRGGGGADKRTQVRYPLTGDLTGALRSASSGGVIPCIAVDISKGGMRVVLSLDLAPGSELFLNIRDAEHKLLVVWCDKEVTRKGYYSCGLRAIDPTIDLTALFAKGGWLKGS
jgi:hypothetical protein